MDNEPRAVHPVERHENPKLRKTPWIQWMCQVATVALPWRLLMARLPHYSWPNTDPQDHRPEYARTWPIGLLSRKSYRSGTYTEDKGHLWRCWEGNKRLQGSFHSEWNNVPYMSTDSWEVSKKELTYADHRLCCWPHTEVRRKPTDELGEVPS